MQQPPQLEQLQSDVSLIDVSTTITKNYSTYHQVAEQLKSLQDWIRRIQEESTNVDGRTQNNKEKVR